MRITKVEITKFTTTKMTAKKVFDQSFWFLLVLAIVLITVYYRQSGMLNASHMTSAWVCSGVAFVVYMLIRRSRSLSAVNLPRLASIA